MITLQRWFSLENCVLMRAPTSVSCAASWRLHFRSGSIKSAAFLAEGQPQHSLDTSPAKQYLASSKAPEDRLRAIISWHSDKTRSLRLPCLRNESHRAVQHFDLSPSDSLTSVSNELLPFFVQHGQL